MRVVVPNNFGEGGRRAMTPPIPLERPASRALQKHEVQTYKLRNAPDDPESPTYDVSVPFFSSGTVEEWLMFRRDLEKVIVGQNLTGGPARYRLARTLLRGEALGVFEATSLEAAETTNNFKVCMDAVAQNVFPARAVLAQKRFMRRKLRKPAGTGIRDFVARLVEMNNWLPKFPGADIEKLPDDELAELLEFGVPNSWQKAMVLQNFNPTIHPLADFVEFCERLERIEAQEGNNPTNGGGKRKKPEQKSENGKRKNSGGSKFCMLHGENRTHTTEECRTLKFQAKKMRAVYDAQAPDQKANYKKKQEIHAVVADKMDELVKDGTLKLPDGKQDKKRAKRAIKELKNFEKLSISSDDEGSSSDDDSSVE